MSGKRIKINRRESQAAANKLIHEELMKKIEAGKVNSFLELIKGCVNDEAYKQMCVTVSESGLPAILYCSPMDHHLLQPSFGDYCRVQVDETIENGQPRFNW